jgi:PAS domain S-box-containing protein
MDWLIPAIVATLTATLILALVYAFLYLQERRLALGLWTLAWIFSCVRYVIELGLHDRRNDASYFLGVQLFSLLTGVFLLWGCFAWVQRRLPVTWLLVAGLCCAWVIGGVVAQVNPLWITYPTFFFTGAVFLINGILFLRHRDMVGVGRWIVGVAFILWGLHKFDYPLLRELAWFAPWGYLFSSSLSVIVAVGLLLAHFERDQRILRLSQSQVQSLLDATQETLVMIDRDGIVLACNDIASRRLGKPAAELLGQNLYTILPEPLAASRRQKAELTFRTGRTIEFEDERDGHLYSNYISPVLDPDGSVRAVSFFAEDITQRRRAEAERNRLFTYSVDLLCIAGFDGFFRELNPAWTQTLGWSETELKSRSWFDFVHPDDQAATTEAGKRLAQGQTVLCFDNRYRCKDGSWRWLSWNSFPLPDQGTIFAIARDVTEQKSAEQILQDRETMLNSIYRAAPVGIGIFRNRVFCQVNGRFCEMIGYSREEMIGQSARMLYPSQDDFDRVGRDHYDQVRRYGIGSIETRWKSKDGTNLDILLSSAPLDSQDLSLGVVVTATDITERKRAEEEVQKLASVVRHSKELVNLAMPDGRMIFLNEAGRILLGIDPDDVPKTYILDVIPDHLKEKARNELLAVLMRGDTWEGDLQYRNLKTGNLIDVRTIAFPVVDPHTGQIQFFANVSQDITERKQAEKTLKESEQRFRRIVEASPMGMHLYELRDDGELVLIDANPAADRHTGIHTADRIGKTIEQAFPGLVGTEVPARYKQIAAGGPAWQTTNLFYQDNAIHGAFDIVAFQTVPGRMATMFLEVSDRIRAEQQREQLLKDLQAKTEELESIIYVSSHDLRSPLVNIQGFSGELGESCRQIRKLLSGNAVPESNHQQLEELLGQDIPSAIEYITTSVSKLDALQKGLLKICHIGRESLEIAPVAMNELIEGILKSTRYQLDNCRAQVTVEPLPNCLADAGQLTQVFTNLIDNAIKYRSPDRPLQIRIYGRVEDSHSVYAVADNGVGIAPEHQPKVFEMFHQLDPLNGPGGEGLGLTIVKRILGRMDGQVRLESAVGVGSVFFVLLPKA